MTQSHSSIFRFRMQNPVCGRANNNINGSCWYTGISSWRETFTHPNKWRRHIICYKSNFRLRLQLFHYGLCESDIVKYDTILTRFSNFCGKNCLALTLYLSVSFFVTNIFIYRLIWKSFNLTNTWTLSTYWKGYH